MTKEITLEAAPDLRRIYATAALRRRQRERHRARRAGRPGRRAGRRDDLVGIRPGVPCPGGGHPAAHLPAPGRLSAADGRHERRRLPAAAAGGRARREPIEVHPTRRRSTSRSTSSSGPRTSDRTVVARRSTSCPRSASRGEPVWRGVSTYLSRGTEHADAPVVRAAVHRRRSPPSRLGRCGGSAEGTGRAYAAVSGDWNPIHLHALTARPLGFPTAIAHGMYTYARVMRALGATAAGGRAAQPRVVPQAGAAAVDGPAAHRFERHASLSVLEDDEGESARRRREHLVAEPLWHDTPLEWPRNLTGHTTGTAARVTTRPLDRPAPSSGPATSPVTRRSGGPCDDAATRPRLRLRPRVAPQPHPSHDGHAVARVTTTATRPRAAPSSGRATSPVTRRARWPV